LTAASGAWIRLEDQIGRRQVVVVFIRHIDDTTGEWLKELHDRCEDLDTLDTDVVAVHTARTDRLRKYKNSIGIGFPLTYDPFAVEARRWRASARVRPITQNRLYIVDIDGNIAWSHSGLASVSDILAAAAEAKGVAVPTTVADPLDVATVRHIDSAEAVAFLEEDGGGWLLLDVRTRSEFDADHAPMAVHIPVDELPQRSSELGQTNKVLCVCQAGGRSQAAAEFLVSIGGHDIFNVMGGMSAWGGPRVTGGVSA
jgi:rhodanese-related sulfurtransferase/peroxiredoxin